MIGYLEGTILKKLEKSIIVNTGSVGYIVHIPAPLLEKTQEKEQIQLFIHTKVREDDISLFGFDKTSSMDFFKQLININGIGPKTAMEIMSHNIEKTKAAIVMNDIAYLSKIPGIGKKTAERIVIELKNKVEVGDLERMHQKLENHQQEDEAIDALLNLGYQRQKIIHILKKLPENIKTTEETIKYFLKNV